MNIFETGELIGKTSRLLTKSLSKNLLESKTGITSEQWIILQILVKDSKNQKELSEITLKSKATINSLVSYLVKSELITKTKSKIDNRNTILSISKKGINVINQTKNNAFQSIKQATTNFSDKEILELNKYLSIIITNLNK